MNIYEKIEQIKWVTDDPSIQLYLLHLLALSIAKESI
jgi:hypothetical protein